MSLVAILMAAGKGTRMRSERPKVLHEILGVPLLWYPFQALRELGVRHVITVVGHGREQVEAALMPFAGWFDSFTTVVQEPQKGTGHAVMVTRDLAERYARVLVLNGDMPCMSAEGLGRMIHAFEGAEARVSAMTTLLDDPTGFGRIVRGRDGSFERICEHKDALERPELLTLREVNGGVYLAETRLLFHLLDAVSDDNAQGEYYLPDVLATAKAWGELVLLHPEDDAVLLTGINTRRDLWQAERVLQARQIQAALDAGVTVQGDDVRLAPDARVAADVTLGPGVEVRAGCTIEEGAIIETGCVLADSHVGRGARLKPYSVLEGARVGPEAIVGPFARLRPGTVLGPRVHVGNFVETKKAVLGEGAKANHLSYLGDAQVGARTNVGAGTITCNYDGYAKHVTTIGEDVLIGSDTQLVAPVRVGDGAVLGAGTTLTADVPAGALALTRPGTIVKEGYRQRLAARYRKEDQ